MQTSSAEAVEAAGMLRPSTGPVVDRATARERLGIGVHDFVVCSFGELTVFSGARRVLDAWLAAELSEDAIVGNGFADHFTHNSTRRSC